MASNDHSDRRLTDALRVSPLFRSLAEPRLTEIESELVRVRLRGGSTLFHAGDPGDALYLVRHGRLRALVAGPGGRQQVLGEIGRGESVGEMAVLTGEPRSATVRAVRDTELVRLSKDAFERLAMRDPQLMLEFSRLIIARYQGSLRARPTFHPTALAVVPTSDAVPIADFVDGLTAALSAAGRVLRLSPPALASLGAPTSRDLSDDEGDELAGWLNAREQEHDFMLYLADPRPSDWTRRCLRQADVALILAPGADEPALHPELRRILAGTEEDGSGHHGGRAGNGASAARSDTVIAGARRELVLLYDRNRGSPQGTARWLALLPVAAHHHLDPAVPAHFARLSRMLRGRATGLVLGGGGARGLAHLGVLRALEDAGVPIDLVGGTSMGAVVGALYASGRGLDRVREIMRRGFVESGRLNDYTLPLLSLLKGDRFRRLAHEFYGDGRIEDLPLTYFCISTNLTRGRSEVHRQGPLTKWVWASSAVPGLGPPIFREPDILVDGGVTNNLPVDVMRAYGRGPVFAVNVSPKIEMRLDRNYPDTLSPWRLLLSRANPFSEPIRVPGIGSILMRTVSLPLGTGPAKAELADLLFEPSIGDFGLLDWKRFDELVQIGYRCAVAQLEERERRGSAEEAVADVVADRAPAPAGA